MGKVHGSLALASVLGVWHAAMVPTVCEALANLSTIPAIWPLSLREYKLNLVWGHCFNSFSKFNSKPWQSKIFFVQGSVWWIVDILCEDNSWFIFAWHDANKRWLKWNVVICGSSLYHVMSNLRSLSFACIKCKRSNCIANLHGNSWWFWYLVDSWGILVQSFSCWNDDSNSNEKFLEAVHCLLVCSLLIILQEMPHSLLKDNYLSRDPGFCEISIQIIIVY